MSPARLLPLLLAATLPGIAQALELALPVQCEPGESCWIPRYVDHDPGPGFRDYMCGRLGSDGHSGTDFAIRNLAEMQAGVPVLAAAAGTVRGVRDGMEDVSVEEIGMAAIEGRNCGNGVVLAHEGGWETQYCHLRQGSVAVRAGERVAAGRRLGLVGLSGETSYPHAHLSVRKDGREVDPFTGLGAAPGCGPGAEPLWSPEVAARLPYRPLLLTNAGFAAGRPEWEEVQAGGHAAAVLPAAAPALVLWLEAFALEPGDVVGWRITGPDGAEILAERRPDKGNARAFRFAGRRAPEGGWPPGRYVGTVTLERPGTPPQQLTRAVELR
jgi:murein DD-endopeptidase MepM/ murein hydrolase activator NlpD